MTDRPLPSSFDDNADFYNERPLQKVIRRLKEEPLVPIGCILTVAAFTNAYRATRRGDHQQVQRMFRARVAAQAFTVIAIVAGGAYYSKDRQKQRELWKIQQQQEAEEKRQKWIRELEIRDEEDKALKEKLEKRKKRAAERTAGSTSPDGVAAQARAALEASKVVESSEATGGDKSGDGVLGSLGGWFKSSKPTQQGVPPESGGPQPNLDESRK
ncbi:hypoxia induced protein conserved region-domain-containing protein [Echria macrotheca]|uniref:Hypoxia induced protein conserved region-domain-containing protein n=1 Tax=Echria macrotheca TaxID=438768 RepID=A0AAJ0F9S9_9PEZI|nr:hypoxia induced protein conserved region-domain-containing protein [Echria macrotheca]